MLCRQRQFWGRCVPGQGHTRGSWPHMHGQGQRGLRMSSCNNPFTLSATLCTDGEAEAQTSSDLSKVTG